MSKQTDNMNGEEVKAMERVQRNETTIVKYGGHLYQSTQVENLDKPLGSQQILSAGDLLSTNASASNHVDEFEMFTRFPELPPELRLKIWKNAGMLPRLIEAMGCLDDDDPFIEDLGRRPNTDGAIPLTLVTKACPSALFRVCKESRSVALTIFPVNFEIMEHPISCPINPDQDTVVFVGSANPSYPIPGTARILLGDCLSPEAQSNIQSIAVSCYEMSTLIPYETIVQDSYGIVKFTGLKQLTVIVHKLYCTDAFKRSGDITFQDVQASGKLANGYNRWLEIIDQSIEKTKVKHPTWIPPVVNFKVMFRGGEPCCAEGRRAHYKKKLKIERDAAKSHRRDAQELNNSIKRSQRQVRGHQAEIEEYKREIELLPKKGKNNRRAIADFRNFVADFQDSVEDAQEGVAEEESVMQQLISEARACEENICRFERKLRDCE